MESIHEMDNFPCVSYRAGLLALAIGFGGLDDWMTGCGVMHA
jgi:hypothetical protein